MSSSAQQEKTTTLRLTKATYMSWLAIVITRLRGKDNGARAVATLNELPVTEAAYFVLNAQARARHEKDDAALSDAIRASTHLHDLHLFAKYLSHTANSPDGANIDPGVPTWCRSMGRAAYDYASTRFRGFKPGDVAAHKSELMALHIQQFQGNVPLFEQAYTVLSSTYLTAAASANIDTASFETDYTIHLTEMFFDYDRATYDYTCKEHRHKDDKNVASFLTHIGVDYKASHKNGSIANPSVLTTDTPSGSQPLPRPTADTMSKLLAAINTLTAATTRSGASTRDRSGHRTHRSASDERLLTACKKHSICFRHIKGRCHNENCRFSHAPLPSGVSANVTQASSIGDCATVPEITLLTSLIQEEPLFHPEDEFKVNAASGTVYPEPRVHHAHSPAGDSTLSFEPNPACLGCPPGCTDCALLPEAYLRPRPFPKVEPFWLEPIDVISMLAYTPPTPPTPPRPACEVDAFMRYVNADGAAHSSYARRLHRRAFHQYMGEVTTCGESYAALMSEVRMTTSHPCQLGSLPRRPSASERYAWMSQGPQTVCVAALPSASAAAVGNLFVIDTGANGVVIGGAGMKRLKAAMGLLTPTPHSHISSNAHRDSVVGRTILRGNFSGSGTTSLPAQFPALLCPSSKWNVMPPQLVPGFESAFIGRDGSLHIIADGRTLHTTNHQGLHVLRFDPLTAGVDVTVATTARQPPSTSPSLVVRPPASSTLVRLHETLSHVAASTIHRLIRLGAVHCPDEATRRGLLATSKIDCAHCALASNPKQRVQAAGHNPSVPARGLWGADLFGPMVSSAGGAKYCSVWVSHHTGFTFVGFHKQKSDAVQWFMAHIDDFERIAGGISTLRTDGGELSSDQMTAFCSMQGISRQLTAPGSSFQNGHAERKIRTLRALAGASLSRSGMSPSFWANAVSHAVYVDNRLPRPTASSPHERALGSPPTLRYIHPFGCLVLSRVPQPKKSRLAAKSRHAVHLGAAEQTKDAFKIVHLDTRSAAVSRNLVFFDSEFPFNRSGTATRSTTSDAASQNSPEDPNTRLPAHVLAGNPYAALADLDSDSIALRRPSRVTAKPNAYDPAALDAQRQHDRQRAGALPVSVNVADTPPDLETPLTARSALASANRARWLDAIRSELASHRLNGTWTPATPPRGANVVPAKWVLKLKRNANGEVCRFKARLVAKGFRQRYNGDTFAPTLRSTTFRVSCALACQRGFALHQLDVTCAFLEPNLEEEVFMRLPEQDLIDEHLPEFTSPKTVLLKKALYGLVNSPRLWFKSLTTSLKDLAFTQTNSDPCLWIKVVEGRIVAFIAFFVDDCLVGTFPSDIDSLKASLQRRYRMTDGGPVSWFLGVRIQYDFTAGNISLDQGTTVMRLLEDYNMSDCKPLSTPAEGTLPPSTDETDESMRDKPYRALVGSLLYLLFTRPDIAFAVNQLTRHLNNPSPAHWQAAKRVLRYLRGTTNLGLQYTRQGTPELTGYSDADFAADIATRRSTSGYVFLLNGAAVSWKTKLQPSVSLSTCESELIALAYCVQEGIWLRRLLGELLPEQDMEAIEINEDNQSTIALVRNHRFSDRTKHVDIRYFFMREHFAEGKFAIQYCPTQEMIADIFTKALKRVTFEYLRSKLGMKDLKKNKDKEDKKKEDESFP
jgi:transposase InsO family protein